MVKHEEGEETQERVGEVERWTGWLRGVAGEGQRATHCRSCLSGASRSGLPGQKQDCWQEKFVALISLSHVFSSSLSVVALRCSHSAPHLPPPRLPTSFSFHPPILHRLIWHIPALIVQAEPLALFKICIRMLFLYSSKRRHVESLLNCSANRWRFSRCLYEIKWNIPIKKKDISLCPFTLHCLTFSLSCLSFSFCLRLFCFFFFFFLARLRLGQGHGAAESAVESRQVCVTNNYFPRRASERAPSISQSLEQTGPVSATLQAQGGSSCFSSAAWTCLTLTQVG